MKTLLALAALAASLALAGCNSSSERRSDDFGRSLGSSFEGGLGRDTYGTNRRMDVYGGATAPSLPTIGASGYGK